MSEAEKKLQELGISLPDVPAPVASYVPGVQTDDFLFVSGQLSSIKGEPIKGKLGSTMNVEEGYAAAKISGTNCLAVLKSLVGDLDNIEKIVKVTGFVNSSSDFDAPQKVVNGASELFSAVFGEAGVHSRSAVGVASLPLGACCEIEVIAKVRRNNK